MLPETLPAAGPEAPVCVQCQSREALPGVPTPLCAECRERFIRYPVPKWILLFAGLVGLVMIAGLFRMPQYLMAGIHMGRGQKAAEAHRYQTAAREMDLVLSDVPDSKEAHAYKLLASCYSLNVSGIQSSYAFLQDKSLEDEALVAEVKSAMEFVTPYFEEDTLMEQQVANVARKDSVAGLLRLYADLDTAGTYNHLSGRFLIANQLFDWKAYDACEALLTKLLSADDRLYPALNLMAAVKREQHQYDAALAYCDKVLAINREDLSGIVQKAKIELKRHHDEAARQYTEEAMLLAPEDVRSLEAKTLTTFYAGRQEESRRLLARLGKAEGDSEQVVYRRTLGIINGTTPYR